VAFLASTHSQGEEAQAGESGRFLSARADAAPSSPRGASGGEDGAAPGTCV